MATSPFVLNMHKVSSAVNCYFKIQQFSYYWSNMWHFNTHTYIMFKSIYVFKDIYIYICLFFFQGEHSNSFLQTLKLFSFSLLLIFTLCERACQNLMLSPFSSVHSSICTPPSLPSCDFCEIDFFKDPTYIWHNVRFSCVCLIPLNMVVQISIHIAVTGQIFHCVQTTWSLSIEQARGTYLFAILWLLAIVTLYSECKEFGSFFKVLTSSLVGLCLWVNSCIKQFRELLHVVFTMTLLI